MVVAPSFHRSEAAALNALRAHGARAAIGLHVTLSAPFQPLTAGFTPLATARSPRSRDAGARRCLRQLDRKALAGGDRGADPDVRRRVRPRAGFHRRPSARASLPAGARRAVRRSRERWRRMPGSASAAAPAVAAARLGDPKGFAARRPEQALPRARGGAGHRTNPAFAGTYAFNESADFAALFPRFLDGLPDGGWSCAIPALSMPSCGGSTR